MDKELTTQLAAWMGEDYCDINENGEFEFCSDGSVVTYTYTGKQLLQVVGEMATDLNRLANRLALHVRASENVHSGQ